MRLVTFVFVTLPAVAGQSLCVLEVVTVGLGLLQLPVRLQTLRSLEAQMLVASLLEAATGTVLEASLLKTFLLEASSMLETSVLESGSQVLSVKPVVLQHQTTAMLVLGLRVYLFQSLLRFALLERVLQKMAVFFLDVDRDRVEMLELDRLM